MAAKRPLLLWNIHVRSMHDLRSITMQICFILCYVLGLDPSQCTYFGCLWGPSTQFHHRRMEKGKCHLQQQHNPIPVQASRRDFLWFLYLHSITKSISSIIWNSACVCVASALFPFLASTSVPASTAPPSFIRHSTQSFLRTPTHHSRAQTPALVIIHFRKPLKSGIKSLIIASLDGMHAAQSLWSDVMEITHIYKVYI